MNTLLLNKPYHVLSQFTDGNTSKPLKLTPRSTLADYVDLPNFYPAGRLDYDSEGLILLTNNGQLQNQISNPRHKLGKSYWVQVEGTPPAQVLRQLRSGVNLKDGITRPAKAELLIFTPKIWPRNPEVAAHRDANSQWLNITLYEGKNRQVRRMMAAVGHPVLRLIRHQIGSWSLGDLQPGEYKRFNINLPQTSPLRIQTRKKPSK